MLSEVKVKLLVAQSRLTFCSPMDCSLPGSSPQGILQAQMLEWVAMTFSRGSSRLRDQTGSLALQAGSLSSGPPEKVKVAQSYPVPCDPMDYTVHGIFQARILEWVAFPFSRGSSQPRDGTQVSHIVGRFFAS